MANWRAQERGAAFRPCMHRREREYRDALPLRQCAPTGRQRLADIVGQSTPQEWCCHRTQQSLHPHRRANRLALERGGPQR